MSDFSRKYISATILQSEEQEGQCLQCTKCRDKESQSQENGARFPLSLVLLSIISATLQVIVRFGDESVYGHYAATRVAHLDPGCHYPEPHST